MYGTVAITGTSGVLGSNLASYLLSNGYSDIIGIDVVDPPEKEVSGLRFVKSDIRDTAKMEATLSRVDIVIHAASAAPSYPAALIEQIVVDGTRSMLEAAWRNKVRRFVYVSSTAVYGIPKRVPCREDDELQPYHDAYNRSKVHAEQLCLSSRKRGLVVPVIRPRTFLGPGRMGTFSMLNEWAYEGHNFPIIGNGLNRYQFLDVHDLCASVRLAMEKDEYAVNDVFNIGAEAFGTLRDDFQSVLDAAGHGKRVVPLPATPVLVALRSLEAMHMTSLYRRLYEKLVIDYYVSLEKAKAQLGFRAQYSNRDSLVRCYRWYVEQLATGRRKTGVTNSVAWRQGVLRLAKAVF